MVDLTDAPDTSPKYHLECRLEGASENINGLPMRRQADGSVRTIEPVARAVARDYNGMAGWSILDADAPEPGAAGAPEPEFVPPTAVEGAPAPSPAPTPRRNAASAPTPPAETPAGDSEVVF